MSLRPILASQAPNVSSITLILVFGAFATDRDKGTNRTRLKVTPSKDSKVIKKCDWLEIRFRIATTGNRNTKVIIELYIELRDSPIFDLQDRCLLLAFNSQIAHKVIFDTQGQYFKLNYYLCVIPCIFLAWKANVLITPCTLCLEATHIVSFNNTLYLSYPNLCYNYDN